MARNGLSLEGLLAPIGVESFFRDYWEKAPLLLSRDNPNAYAGLLSMADVEHVIAFTRPKFVDTAAVAAGAPRATTVVQGWLADRQLHDEARYPGIDELQRVYAQGKTVVIMTVQQRWMPVAALCRSLEAVFHCPAHANLYLTPKGAQGFAPHFDPHEVFVLQLEGMKHWRIYQSARKFPLVDERFDVARDRLPEPREVRLEPGDLLYLPRGFVHEAFTAETASLHLTVGINVYRWADLLHEAIDAVARREEDLRASLPPGAFRGPGPPDDLRERFHELAEAFARLSSPEEAFRLLGDRFFGQLPVLPGAHFVSDEGAEAPDLETVLERSPGVVGRVIQEGGWVVLVFPGGQVGGPLKIASALRFVAAAARFRVRDLPGDLSDKSKCVLARRLLRERLVRVAPGSLEGAAMCTAALDSIDPGT
jgi:ribosomal protein L16 Arg81 hydroxylase